MNCDISLHGPTLVAGSLPAKFDYGVCNAFHNQLRPHLDESPAALVVDLAGVTFMDSCAIGTLITIRNRLMKDKTPMFLCGLSEQVAKIIKITDLGRVFELADDRQAALGAAAAAGRGRA